MNRQLAGMRMSSRTVKALERLGDLSVHQTRSAASKDEYMTC